MCVHAPQAGLREAEFVHCLLAGTSCKGFQTLVGDTVCISTQQTIISYSIPPRRFYLFSRNAKKLAEAARASRPVQVLPTHIKPERV